MKNPKPEIRMTKEIRSTNDEACPLPTMLASGFGLRHSFVIGFVLLHSFCCLEALAQSYSTDWSKIAGGGGTSTNAQYSLSGTIGQPDASATPMAGGNFSITGGFWALLSAVQTPGAPLLSISLTSTNTAMVSWPSPSAGFVLQQNTNGIGTVNWSNAVETPADNGTTKYIIVDQPGGNRFFRLFKP